MKKTYKAPAIELTEIKMESMIAASGPIVLTDPADPETAQSKIFDILFDDGALPFGF